MSLKKEAHAVRPRLVTGVFLLVMLSTFAYFFAVGAITPTLPRYVEEVLGGSSVAVGLSIGAFAMTAVLLRPYSGRLSDEKGRRVLILFGGALVGLSIAGYALTQTLVMLVVLRLVSGVGEAFFYVGVASVINDLAPNERRGEALSYFSLALFGGLAVGPVVGESILDATSFSWVWAIAGAASLVAGILGLWVPETRPEGARNGRRHKQRLLHGAAIMPGTVMATSIWALATFTSFITLYALSIGLSGGRFVFVLNSVVIIAIRLFGARLPDRLGAKKAGSAALVSTAIGMATIALWDTTTGLFAGTFVYSIGHALAFPALMSLAIGNAPDSERGAVVGTFTAFFDLAFGVGAISAGWIAELLGYDGAFLGAAGVALVGLAILLTYARTLAQRREMGSREPAVEAVGR